MSSIKVGKLLFTLPVNNKLGEGVQWHCESQSIWWTDIENANLFRYSVKKEQITKYSMPDRVGSFAFIENDPRIIVAFAKGIALYDFTLQRIEWLAQPEKYISHTRFNDGRVDRQGRFWAGTMDERETSHDQCGALYVFDSQQGVRKAINNIDVSNSLCWSPDGLTMYHADSPKRVIYQYSYDPVIGEISNKKLFSKSKVGSLPDGATVDAAAGVWVAHWGGGEIVRYTPSGKINLTHKLAVSQPTCISIGGPNMDWLIVTSAKYKLSDEQLKNEPHAGDVFVYQLQGVTGLPESLYRHK